MLWTQTPTPKPPNKSGIRPLRSLPAFTAVSPADAGRRAPSSPKPIPKPFRGIFKFRTKPKTRPFWGPKAMSAREKIQALEARRTSMKADYEVMEPVFRAVQAQLSPTKGRFFEDMGGPGSTAGTGGTGGRRRSLSYNHSLIDNQPLIARRTLVSGLAAGVTSPSRPWFRLTFHDRAVAEDYEASAWLHLVERRLYDVLRASNTYHAFRNCYESLAVFGVYGGIITSDFDRVMHTYSLPVGSFYLGQDHKSRVNPCIIHRGRCSNWCSSSASKMYPTGSNAPMKTICTSRCASIT